MSIQTMLLTLSEGFGLTLVIFFLTLVFSLPLGLLVAAVFCVELLYAVLLVVCGFPVALGQALLLRGLPCALYDTVLAVALFLIMRFVLGRIEARQHELPLVR